MENGDHYRHNLTKKSLFDTFLTFFALSYRRILNKIFKKCKNPARWGGTNLQDVLIIIILIINKWTLWKFAPSPVPGNLPPPNGRDFCIFWKFHSNCAYNRGQKSQKSVKKWFFGQIVPIMVAVFQGFKKINIYIIREVTFFVFLASIPLVIWQKKLKLKNFRPLGGGQIFRNGGGQISICYYYNIIRITAHRHIKIWDVKIIQIL